MKFETITVDPAVFGGKPCIVGMRSPRVAVCWGSWQPAKAGRAILRDYPPYLEAADIDEALRYAVIPLARDQTVEHAG